jgi:hypothetical protein
MILAPYTCAFLKAGENANELGPVARPIISDIQNERLMSTMSLVEIRSGRLLASACFFVRLRLWRSLIGVEHLQRQRLVPTGKQLDFPLQGTEPAFLLRPLYPGQLRNGFAMTGDRDFFAVLGAAD